MSANDDALDRIHEGLTAMIDKQKERYSEQLLNWPDRHYLCRDCGSFVKHGWLSVHDGLHSALKYPVDEEPAPPSYPAPTYEFVDGFEKGHAEGLAARPVDEPLRCAVCGCDAVVIQPDGVPVHSRGYPGSVHAAVLPAPHDDPCECCGPCRQCESDVPMSQSSGHDDPCDCGDCKRAVAAELTRDREETS